MEPAISQEIEDKTRLHKLASHLGLATVLCITVTGCISVFLGFRDKSWALTGFGLNLFIGVIYGLGIWSGIRTRARNYAEINGLGTVLLSIAGRSYYALAPVLAVFGGGSILRGYRPEEVFPGVLIPLCFIAAMLLLDNIKTRMARQHNIWALLADANLTSAACIYPSVILFLSSIGYDTFGIQGLDAAGLVGIAVSSLLTGRSLLGKLS